MIKVHNLTKHFGQKVAVNDLSFEVQPGVVTGFLGPNGAGKTTTLRMLLGLTHPDKGTATINGVPYQQLQAPMREVGAILDAKAYHPGRKARDHLLVLAEAGAIPSKRVDEVLDLVGLNDVADKRAGSFSLGMAQRLGIATALLGDPAVLLFDEPVNGLDPEGIRLGPRADAIARRPGAHRLRVQPPHVGDVAHRLARDRDRQGPPDRRLHHRKPRQAAARAGPCGCAARRADLLVPRLAAAGASVTTEADGAVIVGGLEAAAIGDLAFAANAPVHELSPQEASLEEAFMELTQDETEFHAHEVARP